MYTPLTHDGEKIMTHPQILLVSDLMHDKESDAEFP